MKLLIIGSEGFIGKHCVVHFSMLGYDVYTADVVETNLPNYTCLPKANTNFDDLFKTNKFDYCINASGSAHVGFSFDNPAIDFELNVLNVHKLLVSIRTYNANCKFINFSSAAVYGNPERLPITEEQVKNPLSPYGFHKLQSEYLVKEYHRFFNIGTASLRIFSAYGPGLKKQLFWDLFQKTSSNQKIELFGNGNETRDFIYIDDLVIAIQVILEKSPFDGSSYNIASGLETKISDVVSAFYHELNPSIHFQFSGQQKMGDPDNWVADISKIRSLGFNSTTSMQQGLAQTANWMKSLSS